jgi:glycosyltransferase involved in cell wall biosynthesis
MPGAGRVLIVTATDRRRGAEVFTERLGRGLSTHGWEVETVSLTTSGDERTVGVQPLTDVSSASPGRFNRRIGNALAERLDSFRPDVLLANGGSTLRYGAVAARGSEAALVYIAIGEPEYWIRGPVSRVANRWMLGQTRMVLAVCERTRSQLLALEPSLAPRVHVTYTGVPDEMFVARHAPPDAPLRVVVIGSLSDEKDPLLAVRSVAMVPGAVLRLVGAGPLTTRVEDEVAALGMEERVELTGSVDDVAPHLGWASVLLLTSRTEGLPGAVLEAGAASVPAVVVDVGGAREAVSEGVTGLVVSREAGAEGLAAAMISLADDPELMKRMGRDARLFIKERFAMDHIVSGYAARLAEAVGR